VNIHTTFPSVVSLQYFCHIYVLEVLDLNLYIKMETRFLKNLLAPVNYEYQVVYVNWEEKVECKWLGRFKPYFYTLTVTWFTNHTDWSIYSRTEILSIVCYFITLYSNFIFKCIWSFTILVTYASQPARRHGEKKDKVNKTRSWQTVLTVFHLYLGSQFY